MNYSTPTLIGKFIICTNPLIKRKPQNILVIKYRCLMAPLDHLSDITLNQTLGQLRSALPTQNSGSSPRSYQAKL